MLKSPPGKKKTPMKKNILWKEKPENLEIFFLNFLVFFKMGWFSPFEILKKKTPPQEKKKKSTLVEV